MGVRDQLKGLGKVAAKGAAGLLLDWAGNPIQSDFYKAEGNAPSPDEDQDRAPGGTAQDTSDNAPVPDLEAKMDPKSLFWDPYAIVEQLGYKERPSSITYGTLKAIVWKVPTIQAIIQTRVNQVASFATPQRNRYQLG